MNSQRIKSDVKKLFEYWCELKPSAAGSNGELPPGVGGGGGGRSPPAGVIVEGFPKCFRDDKTIAEIPNFAYPCEIESNHAIETYSFVLTTEQSKWRFGFCRHDPHTGTALVILTYLPWHTTFIKLISVLAELRRNDPNEFTRFLAAVYSADVPLPGRSLTLPYYDGQSSFTFDSPPQYQLPSIPDNHNLNLYYNFVYPKNMIAVFAAMLAERRIIFTSHSFDRLSSCVQAANAFLYPLVWQHIFIPLIPMKLKDYLSAPMPYLIGVPEQVMKTMTPDELGEVEIFNCDTKSLETPFNDIHQMPSEIVSYLKTQLAPGHSRDHMGDRVSKIFLSVMVQLIGGYRHAVDGKTFHRQLFIDSRPSHLRSFLTKMLELQCFSQFIDERIEMLQNGQGVSDEFEMETVRYDEKMRKRSKDIFKQIKDKTNPAVKSAVKSVKESSRGVKLAYNDLKSKLRDITPPNNSHFRSYPASNSQHDHIDGYVVVNNKLVSSGGSVTGTSTSTGHRSAPSSPLYGRRTVSSAASSTPFQYASPRDITGASSGMRRAASPLAISSSAANIHANGYARVTLDPAANHLGVAASPAESPAGSLNSSEMNLSQELQNHPLFKTPVVDRSLKPSGSLDMNHQQQQQNHLNHHHHNHNQYQQHPHLKHHHHYHNNSNGHLQQQRLNSHSGGSSVPPARPPLPTAYALKTKSSSSPSSTATTTTSPPSYYNHPYVAQKHSSPASLLHMHPRVDTKPPPAPRSLLPLQMSSSSPALRSEGHQHHHPAPGLTSTPNKTLTDCVYDQPPSMQSPPVPPRRQQNAVALAAAAVHAGINRLEQNCWSDYDDEMHRNGDPCRSSSSSGGGSTNTTVSSSSSSGSGSFVSATSHLSQMPLSISGGGGGGAGGLTGGESCSSFSSAQTSMMVPIPKPRQKKESLRSLQPQHVLDTSNSSEPLLADKQSVASSQDLITLDDSNNASFDLEDFDPLNQNARPMPPLNGLAHKKKATTLPTGLTSPSSLMMGGPAGISNPLYPYYKPQQPPPPPPTMVVAPPQMPPTPLQPPPLPTTAPPPMPVGGDDDFELLRKYGLDQFTLTTAAAAAAATTTNGPNTMATATGGMRNWTTFE